MFQRKAILFGRFKRKSDAIKARKGGKRSTFKSIDKEHLSSKTN